MVSKYYYLTEKITCCSCQTCDVKRKRVVNSYQSGVVCYIGFCLKCFAV